MVPQTMETQKKSAGILKVAVVILNWNGRDFLEKFLPNVLECTLGDAELIVADNASTDDSISFLEKNYPNIRIIQNAENGGFAKGYNDALKKVESEYYVLLNSDIETTPGWIKPIIKMMDLDEQIAACQPKLLSYNEKHKFEYAGAAGGFIDKLGYPFCRGRIFDTLEEDLGQYDDPKEIFWASGACMFVRSKLFHLAGGFDEDFFAHMEEIDLCWRLKLRDYKIVYCPESTVYHVGGGTLNKMNPFKTYLNFRNNLLLLHKNLPKRNLFPTIMMRLILDGVAGVKFFFSDGPKHTLAIVRAHFSFFGSISATRKKRKQTLIKPVSQVYGGNLLLDYYLSKKKTFNLLDSEKFIRQQD